MTETPTTVTDPVDQAILGALIAEKSGLDKEIGDLKRSSAVVITSSYVVFTAASLAIARAKTTTLGTTRIVLSLLPVVLTLTTIPYMNQSVEVAALAEHRDRLGLRINRLLNSDVMLARCVSGARAGAPGAIAANLAFGLVYVASVGLGLWAARSSGSTSWWRVQCTGTLLIMFFAVAVVKDFLDVRWKVNQRLDEVLTAIDRPRDAARKGSALWSKIRTQRQRTLP